MRIHPNLKLVVFSVQFENFNAREVRSAMSFSLRLLLAVSFSVLPRAGYLACADNGEIRLLESATLLSFSAADGLQKRLKCPRQMFSMQK